MIARAALALAVVAASACGGSGGGGGGSALPSATAPSAPFPSTDACGLIGGPGSTRGTEILSGSACPPDRSSVVLLNMRRDDGAALGACSGTIVAPRAILTAAHCVDEGVDFVRVWLGPPMLEIIATSFVHYPGYVFNRPDLYDVAVIMLGEDISRAPLPILTSRAAQVGETAVLAGWGLDENSVPATLRAGSTTISAVGPSLLQTLYRPPLSSVCNGDSGGPILLQEGGQWVIGGIASATSSNVCNTGTNFYQSVRVDAVRAFIRQHVPDIVER